MVSHMREHLAALFSLTCTTMILGSQGSLAQSPPKVEQDVLIWSDRDLSLRPDSFGSSPDTETSLRLPHIDFPGGLQPERQGQLLLCEPGQLGVTQAGTAAYARVGEKQSENRR
jgi:hypothetical protein